MGVRKDTKQKFAEELERMMRTTPLSKIRVQDLCEHLGVERRVFYYHFRDKYDLVAWIFRQDYERSLEAGASYSLALYEEAHRRFCDHRDFYRRAFECDSQNFIYSYLVEFSIGANEMALKRFLSVPKLSGQYVFEAAHFAHGNIGCVIDWLKGRIDATPKQMAEYMFCCMPKTLAKAYRQQAEGRFSE